MPAIDTLLAVPLRPKTSQVTGLIGERYRIGEPLAETDTGVLFAATDVPEGRTVAVKSTESGAPSSQARLVRRVHVARRLQHPNIASVLDAIVEPEGAVWLLLEPLRGRSLRDELNSQKKLSVQNALEWLLPIMRALQYGHERGIAHGSVNPSTVFLNRDESGRIIPKLIDFAIFPAQESIRANEAATPTVRVQYLSPEQAVGTESGPSADIWGIGAVLYRCLAGTAPFEAETVTGLLYKIIDEPAPLLCAKAPHVGAQIGAAVDRALVRKLTRRYGDMRSFASALVAIARAEGIQLADVADSPAVQASPEENSGETVEGNTTCNVDLPVPPKAEHPASSGIQRARNMTPDDSGLLAADAGSAYPKSSSDAQAPTQMEPTRPSPPPHEEPLPSSLGRFELRRELGRGGMGVVYQAFDPDRRAPVALKSLYRLDPNSIYRLKNEFRVLSELVHPNLVGLHELFAEQDHWFFTMDLVQGEHFIDYVRPICSGQRTLDEARLCTSLRQIVSAVTAIHGAGKLHRDLKPSNVLITAEGRVVVLDFGLAVDQVVDGHRYTLEATILGTPAYISPEQASGEPAGEASDWYAVGVMLYEALTGGLPFDGRALHILSLKQRVEAPDPAKTVADLSPHLCELCSGLLLRDEGQRLTGGDVLQYLDAYEASATASGSTSSVSGAAVVGTDAKAPGLEEAETPSSADQARMPRRLKDSPASHLSGGRRSPPPSAGSERPEPLSLPDEAPFVGRVEELTVLRKAFESTGQGLPVVVFVHGVSGVGKTVLVERFLRGLGREGRAVVLAGRCYERESVPFKAIDELVDALSRYLRRLPEVEAARVLPRELASLTRLFPALERVEVVASAPRPATEIPDPFEVRRRGFAALKEMLGRMSDRQPVVLHVDDLQWGDFDSAMLLQEVLGPPDPPPILFIGSYRRDEEQSSPFLRELLESNRIASSSTQVEMLPVDALGKAEAGRLVELLIGDRNRDIEPLVETICRESEGVPYFIGELVRYAQSAHGVEDLTAGGSGALLPQLLNNRIRALPAQARALLEIISVAGRPLAQELALRTAGIASSGYGTINNLRSAALIRTRGPAPTDAVETYHDRIRETTVSSLDSERRRQCQARLAETLEASGKADAEWLLEQFQGAGATKKAGEYAVVAADQADQVKAFTRAAELYRLALELLRPESEDSLYRELWTKLGDSLANAGRGAESAEAYLHPAGYAPPNEMLVLKRRAAEQYLISGHLKEGFGLMRKVLATLGMRLPETPLGALLSAFFWQARVWLRGFGFKEREQAEIPADELARMDTCWSLSIGLCMTDTVRSLAYISRFLVLALRSGEPYRVALALAVEGAATGAFGVVVKRPITKLLEKADALSKRLGNPHALGLTETCIGAAGFCHGEWRAGYEASERAIKIFQEQCTGVAWELATVRIFDLGLLFFLGELGELSRRAPRLLDEAKQRGDIYAAANFRSACIVAAWLVNDDVEQARQHLNEARADWSFEGYHLQHLHLLWAECLLDFYSGNHDTPWERLRNEWRAIKHSKLLWLQLYRVQIAFIRAASALLAALHSASDEDSGQRRALLRMAKKIAKRLARENFPSARPYARLIQAGIAKAHGDADRAVALLAAAAEHFDAAEMALFAAAARRQCGRLTGGEQGQTLIHDADAVMERQTVKNPERMAAMLAPGFDEGAIPGK